jgi:hypothetical protein
MNDEDVLISVQLFYINVQFEEITWTKKKK